MQRRTSVRAVLRSGAAPRLHRRQPLMEPHPPLGILHVVNSLDYGGLERVVCDLALQQHADGHRVRVFSICDTAGFRDALESAGIPVTVGGKRRTLDLRVLRALRQAATGHGIDILHTHNFVPNYYAATAMLGTRHRHAIVNSCHNMGTRLSNARLRGLYRLSLRRTARVAMVGAQVHGRFTADGIVDPARAVTVLNGIPVGRFSPGEARRRAARAQLGIAEDAPVVGSVGRLVELKNHRLLIACMPALLAAHPTARLVLVGDGPLLAELRAYAQSLGVAAQVVFAGAHDDVAALLPALDIFALPSRTEGLSIALLEACAAQRAVVATAVGGNPEIIEDGVTGRLFASEDQVRLSALLLELLDDAPQRQRLGEAAGRWVQAHASVEAMAGRYREVYADALTR